MTTETQVYSGRRYNLQHRGIYGTFTIEVWGPNDETVDTTFLAQVIETKTGNLLYSSIFSTFYIALVMASYRAGQLNA